MKFKEKEKRYQKVSIIILKRLIVKLRLILASIPRSFGRRAKRGHPDVSEPRPCYKGQTQGLIPSYSAKDCW